MGLIKAAAGAFGGTMADQWKEFFYCDAIDKDVLVVKGEKRVGGRSSNKKGSDNIISSGSGIAVADGQCMIIVEQGKVVEVCAEPGQFTYDASTEPSIFAGSLGEGIHRTFDTVKKRFTFGGDTGKDQRVYYFNTKELVDNKFGTANPIPFRVVDRNIGLDIDVSVRCNGVYSYKIVDPLLFYTNVCGNVEQQYDREEIEVQLKTEFVSALQPAFAKISELQIRPSAIPGHVLELCDAMNEALTKKWQQTRGLAVVSIAMNPVTLPEEDAQLRQELQQSEKDKSELLMIVDLERNDLNRVCKPGSVKVTELFTVEEYATVFHLVSDIEGKLEEGKNVMDLLEAAFPGGSITGAPKYRAMEIIDELEHGKRNLYTGSIGYLTLDGSCDFNIVIRTALHKNGKYHLGVGGGITAESDLEFEYEETLQKAKAILDALQ